MRGRLKRKKRGDNVEERLLSIKGDKAGCEEIDGVYNKKSGECDIRQIRDKDSPDEVTHKKFDVVKRPDDSGGAEKVEDA